MGTEKFIKKTQLEKQLQTVLDTIPDEYLLVDTAAQSLVRVKNGAVVETYPVSTSKYGIGNREGSFKTPLGVHCITEKIGCGAPAGRIFKSRKDTGKDWQKRDNEAQ